MARCTGCGSNLPAKSRFCNICGREAATPGSAYAAPAPGTARTALPVSAPASDASGKRKVAIAATAGALVTALALLLFLKAAGVLGAKPTDTPVTNVLAAPGTRPVVAPVLGQPPVAQPDAPVLAPPTLAENPMPDDVVKYLRFLKAFDEARAQVEYKGYASFMKVFTTMSMNGASTFMKSMDADADSGSSAPTKPVGGDSLNEIAGVLQQMNEATAKFQSYPPPNQCAPLGTAYNSGMKARVSTMATLQSMITQIIDTQNKALQGDGNTDTSALSTMLPQLMEQYENKGMSKEIDASDDIANQALNSLRNQYTSMPEDVRSFGLKKVDLPSPGLPGVK